jgi:two-component system chemotaxis response regulator CheV
MQEEQKILLESGTNELELLAFQLGSQTFGVNVFKVQSIQQHEPSKVTKIPKVHHAAVGMILYRDKTIPLIDLAVALDLKDAVNGTKEIVVITEFNNTVTGFLVDGVKRIHRLNWKDFVPMDTVISNTGASVVGSANIEGVEIMVVDLEQILSVIMPSLVISDLSNEDLDIQKKQKRNEVSVFFAEDSGTIRNNVARILKDSGYDNITLFIDGQKVYDRLKEEGIQETGLPHVLISDIEMPEMDGLTLCKKIKEDVNLKQIVVIMFSSLINKQIITKCESVGADSYITKPEIKKLVDMLDGFCIKS